MNTDADITKSKMMTVRLTPDVKDKLEAVAHDMKRSRLVAWIGGVGALSPTRVPGYAMRTYSGRPSSSIRFSTSAAIATSVACRPSVWKRRPSPMTRFQRDTSDCLVASIARLGGIG